jgi:hemolysin III
MSQYSVFEEKINIYSHVFGMFLGLVGLALLISKSLGDYNLVSGASFIIFGLSIVTLYFASARYHSAVDEKLRFKRKILDHSAIYILIAGTYTPYALAAIGGNVGWIIFGVSWALALIGFILKIFFTGQFKILSTSMYVLMGWMVVFFINPLMKVLPHEGFIWLLLGGISYTIGAVLYSIKKIKLK